ncbi:MAG: DUF4349 domain-containing protein, partial [Bacteroidia bacterium]|nr:DUF4349 domain-containing protein [Bacteroidia bacterium]
MMKSFWSLILFTFLFTACQKQANDYQSIPIESKVENDQAVPSKFTRDDKEDPVKKLNRREVIYTATILMQVDKLQPAVQGIAKMIQDKKGYLASEQHTTTAGQSRVEIVARVPKENFLDFLAAVEKYSVYTESKNITAQDVTEEFVDIEARLRSKKAAEERFLELLKTAKTIGEVMDVENQLRNIREEIEARQGRLQYLQNQVAFSTVTITMYEEKPIIPSPQSGFWY